MASGPFLIHSSTNNVVPFNGATVFTIGRSGECNLDIAAIYISRKQCRIETLRNVGWVIYDESRFKTTKLNNESIGCNYAALKDGDKISFSPCNGSHEYHFHCEEPSINNRKRKFEHELTQVDGMKTPRRKESVDDDVLNSLDLLREMATQSSFSHLSPKKNQAEEMEKLKKENLLLELELKQSRELVEGNGLTVSLLETENSTLLNRIEEVEKSNKQLQETVAVMQSTAQKEDLSSKQACLEDQLLELKMKVDSIDHEKSELKDALTDAETEIDNLLNERCCKILKFGSDSKKHNDTSGMDTLTEVELSLMKEDLKELTKKNSDLSLKLETLAEEKGVFNNKVNEIVDSELYCTICSDLLYQAITLQCKHTFCKSCIDEWKKKKRDCPVCRTKIKSQISSLIVDNIIDKVVEAFGGEMKERREELIRERQAAVKTPTPRQNKRKRATTTSVPAPSFAQQAFEDPLLDELALFPFPEPGVLNGGFHFFPPHNFPDVVDLTNGSPPHQPFRGFERYARRRRR